MKSKLLALSLLISVCLVIIPHQTFAQNNNSLDSSNPGLNSSNPGTNSSNPGTNSVNQQYSIPNPLKCGADCTIFKLLGNIIQNIILPIGGVIAVLAFIYSGFLYVMARGNPTKIATANQALLYSAIGTVLLLGSWVIANILQNTITSLGSGL